MSGLGVAIAVGVFVAVVWFALAAKLVRDDEQRKEEVDLRRREIERERESRYTLQRNTVEKKAGPAATPGAEEEGETSPPGETPKGA